MAISEEGRQRIKEAQNRRWAKKREEAAAAQAAQQAQADAKQQPNAAE